MTPNPAKYCGWNQLYLKLRCSANLVFQLWIFHSWQLTLFSKSASIQQRSHKPCQWQMVYSAWEQHKALLTWILWLFILVTLNRIGGSSVWFVLVINKPHFQMNCWKFELSCWKFLSCLCSYLFYTWWELKDLGWTFLDVAGHYIDIALFVSVHLKKLWTLRALILRQENTELCEVTGPGIGSPYHDHVSFFSEDNPKSPRAS